MKKAALLITITLLLSACTKSPTVDSSTLPYNTTQTVTSVASPTPTASPAASISGTPTTKGIVMTKAKIETSKGMIELELYPEKAPGTVSNFTSKAASGFYKNLTFHRVEDWVIQGGDPVGNGTGGGKMPTELSDVPFEEGSLGVARGGDIKVSNDAQFFICTQACSWLNGQYTIFGKVTKGMDIVKKIAIGDKILSVTTSK